MFRTILIVLFYFSTCTSTETCDTKIEIDKKFWNFTKLIDGKITSVAYQPVDRLIYFVDDGKVFYGNEHNLKESVLRDDLVRDNNPIIDLTSDKLGNLLLTTPLMLPYNNGRIYKIEPERKYIMEYLTIYNRTFGRLSTDSDNVIYFLNEPDHGIDVFSKGQVAYATDLIDVAGAIAVDSHNNIYYRNVNGSTTFYDRVKQMPVIGLEHEYTIDISIDRNDNVFFLTNNGLYFKSRYDDVAVAVTGLNLPKNTVRIFAGILGSLYLASSDIKEGGVYQLKVC